MPPAYRFGRRVERRSLIFLFVLFVVPPMPVALHFLALDPGTLWTLCRDRYSSQAAQNQHAQKRQDGSFHGIGSVHTFVTCQRGEALLYGRALWPDSYHMEVTLWTGTGRQNPDVQGFIVGKKSKKEQASQLNPLP